MTEGIIVTVSRETYCREATSLQGCLQTKRALSFMTGEIISLASQKSGIHEEHFESVEKKADKQHTLFCCDGYVFFPRRVC